MKTVFISDHLDLTEEEFAEHYMPAILSAWCYLANFVVGDASGADAMALKYSRRLHVGRDLSMTVSSDKDIAWVRPGREKSGTAKNLARRKAKNAALW